METLTFIEENNQFKIQSDAADQFVTLNPTYHKTILSDVDLIIIKGNTAILMEYKNSNITGAAKPEVFEAAVRTDEHYMKIARKYYDSLLFIDNLDSPIDNRKYCYVLETRTMDSVQRKRLAAKIKKKLPFELHHELGLTKSFINEFHVMSMNEWNNMFAEYAFSAC